MKEEGIEFRTDVNVGKDITAAELLKDFDRVILCCGASNPRDIKAEGRDAKGIYFAVDFLTEICASMIPTWALELGLLVVVAVICAAVYKLVYVHSAEKK